MIFFSGREKAGRKRIVYSWIHHVIMYLVTIYPRWEVKPMKKFSAFLLVIVAMICICGIAAAGTLYIPTGT